MSTLLKFFRVVAVFDDCTRSSLSLEASAYAAATLQHLSQVGTSSGGSTTGSGTGPGRHVDEAAASGAGGHEAEDGSEAGAQPCWGWACLCIENTAAHASSSSPPPSAHPEANAELDDVQAACRRRQSSWPDAVSSNAAREPGQQFDDKALECFLARAGTDLTSAYLAHFALASRPTLLARSLHSAISYQLQGGGGEGMALAAIDADAQHFIGSVRAGSNEIAQGLLVRPILAVTSFRHSRHASLSVSLTACHLSAGAFAAAASPADSEVCGQNGAVVIVRESVLEWNEALQRYRCRDAIATDGLVGLVRFDVAVQRQVVGLGTLAFKVSDTQMVSLPISVIPRAFAVRATPPDAGHGDAPCDASTTKAEHKSQHNHTQGVDGAEESGGADGQAFASAHTSARPSSARKTGQQGCAGEDADGEGSEQAHMGSRNRRGGKAEPPPPPQPAKTYPVASRVPLGTNFTLDVDLFGGNDAALLAAHARSPFSVTFRVLDASLMPMAVKRVSGNNSLESFKSFHYYLAPDAIMAAGRMHLTLDVSDDATGLIHTRRMTWYTLDIKMAATDLFIDKHHALLGDSITVRMVPGLVTEEGIFRPLPPRAAGFSRFVMHLVRPNGQVVDTVAGLLVDASSAPGCEREEADLDLSKASSGGNSTACGAEGGSAFIFSWRVTRHVRAIGNSLIKFYFQPAEYAGESSALVDLCASTPEPPVNNTATHEAQPRGREAHGSPQHGKDTAARAAPPAADEGEGRQARAPGAKAAHSDAPPHKVDTEARPVAHLPCAPLAFDVSATFRVVLQSGLASPHSVRMRPLRVPLGATISMTFKVLDRSSQTEVHPWGQDAARVFLYVFRDDSGSSANADADAERKARAATSSDDGSQHGHPLAVVEAGAAVSQDTAAKQLVPNHATAAHAGASSGRGREGFSVLWQVGGNTPRTRLILRLKIQVADGADQDLLSAETEEAWQVALQVYTRFEGRTHTSFSLAVPPPIVYPAPPPMSVRGGWVVPLSWLEPTNSTALRDAKGASAAGVLSGAAVPPYLLVDPSNSTWQDEHGTWQRSAYAACLAALKAASKRCASLVTFLKAPWSYAPGGQGAHWGHVVMLAVFSLHSEDVQPLSAAAHLDLDAPHNLTGAELRATVARRVSPWTCRSTLLALLPTWLAAYAVPSALGGPSSERKTYEPVAGLTNLPVISDGRGKYQVSWTLHEQRTSSGQFRAIIYRRVDQQAVALRLAVGARLGEHDALGRGPGREDGDLADKVDVEDLMQQLESEGAVLYQVEMAYMSGSLLRELLVPWLPHIQRLAVYWMLPAALVLGIALCLVAAWQAIAWLANLLRAGVLVALSLVVKGKAGRGRGGTLDAMHKDKKRRRRKEVAQQEPPDAQHHQHHHRTHYLYKAPPPAPRASTSPTAPHVHAWNASPESMAHAESHVRTYLHGSKYAATQDSMPLLLNNTSDNDTDEQFDALAETSHLSQTGSESEAPSTPSRHAMRQASSCRNSRDNQADSASLASSQVSDSYEAEDSDWDNNVSIGSKPRGISQSLLSTTEDDEDLEHDVRQALEQSQSHSINAMPGPRQERGGALGNAVGEDAAVEAVEAAVADSGGPTQHHDGDTEYDELDEVVVARKVSAPDREEGERNAPD